MPVPGQLEHVSTILLLPPDPDVRDRTTPEYLDYFHNRLCPDVEIRGVVVPVVAYREGDKYRVGDGWTRVLAALMKQLPTVPAIIYAAPLSAADRIEASTLANILKLDMSEAERANQFMTVLAARGCSQAELARRWGIDKTMLNRILNRYKDLPPDVLADVGKSIPARAGDALRKLPSHDLIREYADKVRKGLFCVEGLEREIAELVGGKKAKKARPRTFRDGCVTVTYPAEMSPEVLADWFTQQAKKLKKAS